MTNTPSDKIVWSVLTATQDRFHEATVNLTTRKVESNVRLGPNVHGNVDYDEILQVEETIMNDPTFQSYVAKLQLPKDAVVTCDPWIYG
jgi:primary-amine oxidase